VGSTNECGGAPLGGPVRDVPGAAGPRQLGEDRGVERRTRVTGPLPPERVWERYAAPARWSGWAPQIRAGTATWLVVRGPAVAVTAYLPVARHALRQLVRRP
jgi:hypothetical protein